MVWRAAEAGSDRLNFVPTHHWLGNSGEASNGIAGYCYMEHTDPADSSSGSTCRPWRDEVIAEYRWGEGGGEGLTKRRGPGVQTGMCAACIPGCMCHITW
jgi:hypothetical protein